MSNMSEKYFSRFTLINLHDTYSHIVYIGSNVKGRVGRCQEYQLDCPFLSEVGKFNGSMLLLDRKNAHKDEAFNCILKSRFLRSLRQVLIVITTIWPTIKLANINWIRHPMTAYKRQPWHRPTSFLSYEYGEKPNEATRNPSFLNVQYHIMHS